MKVSMERSVTVSEVDYQRKMRLDALVEYLQEAAIVHTEKVLCTVAEMLDSGFSWMLNKVAVRIRRYPLLNETVTVKTWSRGIQKFKGMREFEVWCGEEKIGEGTSLWLYIDTAKKRVVRAPAHLEETYTVETELSYGIELDEWKPEAGSGGKQVAITVRVSDFDVNGHVNNTVYLDYLETALYQLFGAEASIADIRLDFGKEIPLGTQQVTVTLAQNGDDVQFAIGNAEMVYVSGWMSVTQ